MVHSKPQTERPRHPRFVHRATKAAAAVLAPGMRWHLYGDERAVNAIGLLGRIEALAPASAPLVGRWLMTWSSWPASFEVIAAMPVALALAPPPDAQCPTQSHRFTKRGGDHGRLVIDAAFLRQAPSHVLTLADPRILVVGAPTKFVASMDTSIDAFVRMQMRGIAILALFADLAGRLVDTQGPETMMWVAGSCL